MYVQILFGVEDVSGFDGKVSFRQDRLDIGICSDSDRINGISKFMGELCF